MIQGEDGCSPGALSVSTSRFITTGYAIQAILSRRITSARPAESPLTVKLGATTSPLFMPQNHKDKSFTARLRARFGTYSRNLVTRWAWRKVERDPWFRDDPEGWADVCCCGSYVKNHGWNDGHNPVSMRDHAMTSEVNRIVEKWCGKAEQDLFL